MHLKKPDQDISRLQSEYYVLSPSHNQVPEDTLCGSFFLPREGGDCFVVTPQMDGYRGSFCTVSCTYSAR